MVLEWKSYKANQRALNKQADVDEFLQLREEENKKELKPKVPKRKKEANKKTDSRRIENDPINEDTNLDSRNSNSSDRDIHSNS